MRNQSIKSKTFSPQQVLSLGYDVLVENLGKIATAQFMMSAFPGEGDSVKYYRKMREGKTLNDSIQEIRQAKQKGII